MEIASRIVQTQTYVAKLVCGQHIFRCTNAQINSTNDCLCKFAHRQWLKLMYVDLLES